MDSAYTAYERIARAPAMLQALVGTGHCVRHLLLGTKLIPAPKGSYTASGTLLPVQWHVLVSNGVKSGILVQESRGVYVRTPLFEVIHNTMVRQGAVKTVGEIATQPDTTLSCADQPEPLAATVHELRMSVVLKAQFALFEMGIANVAPRLDAELQGYFAELIESARHLVGVPA